VNRVSDVQRVARWVAASERTIDMPDLRRCIGSARFGLEAHEAPVEDFPVQPSQKDGLGRLCKPHWNQYTSGLRKAAAAAKAADTATTPTPIETRPPRAKAKESESVAEDAEAGTV
jgi:hypothetical protein